MTRLRDDASHRQLKELMTEDVGVLKTSAYTSAACLVSTLVVSPTMHPLVPLFIGCWIAASTGWTSKPSNIEYAVVIDAGSTGSRVHVYAWHQGTTPSGRLPRFNMTSNYKVKPGISSFANNIDGIAEHIGDLVSHAKGSVPQGMTDTTPIYLMATAGKSKHAPIFAKHYHPIRFLIVQFSMVVDYSCKVWAITVPNTLLPC